MSKKRLEEIKDKVSLLKNSSELQPHEFLVDVLHLDWLIQKAERVEKLEDDNEALQTLSNVNRKEHMRLHEQNKRYREALEFYADEENWIAALTSVGDFPCEVEEDQGEKARKALERFE